MHEWQADVFARRAQAFGWHAIEIDGHDVASIDDAYTEAEAADRPTLIVARTEKGHGVSFLAEPGGLARQGGARRPGGRRDRGARRDPLDSRSPRRDPRRSETVRLRRARSREPAPGYAEAIATRKAFGETLAWLAGHRPDLVVLDGEVGQLHPHRGLPGGRARALHRAVHRRAVHGRACRPVCRRSARRPSRATFGAFLARAADFVRMGAISRANLRICGSHAGVSIGEDGPSQMALEDLAMFRASHGSTVLYPADGNATVKLVTAMCDLDGHLVPAHDARGDAAALRRPTRRSRSAGRRPCAGATTTSPRSWAPASRCTRRCAPPTRSRTQGIHVRVIDAYSVKPIDADTLREALRGDGTRSWSSRTTGSRAGSATPCSTRSPRPGRSRGRVVKLAVTRDAGLGHA